jgi:phosphopantothenoylcysteine decarboxylase / phosphopantothenate---cysteine ligase
MSGKILLIPDGPASLLYGAELVSRLGKKHYTVQVAPTAYGGPSALAFVGELSWTTLSGHPCLPIEKLDREVFRQQDLVMLSPVSPRVLEVFCRGKAREELLAAGKPVLAVLPVVSGESPVDSAALEALLPPGSRVLQSETPFALGAMGSLGLPSLDTLLFHAEQLLTRQDLAGLSILVTAGPTVEDIDPVRFLSNRSTGKMGVALAMDAALRGARVTLVHGPISAPPPAGLPGLTCIPVRSAQQMHQAVMEHWQDANVAILAAAVADFQPLHYENTKIKKSDDKEQGLVLPLKRTPDILATLGSLPKRPYLVGFAAESDDMEFNAAVKLRKKHCDLICANDIRKPGCGFAVDTNQVTLLSPDAEPMVLPLWEKTRLAHEILSEIKARIAR